MNGYELDGTPTFKSYAGPQGVIILLAASLKKETEGVQQDAIDRARAEFSARGLDDATIERRRVGDLEGLEMVITAEAQDGSLQTTHMCIVPDGHEIYMLSYVAPGSRGEAGTEWATLLAGYTVTGKGLVWWPYAAGGLALLVLLGLVFRGSGAPAPVRRPAQGSLIRGARDMADGLPSRDGPPSSDGLPPRPSTAPGTPSHAPAPSAAADPVPQIPGLRSTLPPSGRWGA